VRQTSSSNQSASIITNGKRKVALGASDRKLGMIMVTPILIFMLALVGFPLVNLLVLSTQKVNFLTKESAFIGLGNFANILRGTFFWESLWKTIVWTIGSLIPSSILGTLIALILNKEFKGRSFVRAFLIFPYLVPTVVVAAIFKYMFNDLIGIINHLLIKIGLLTNPINIFGSPQWAMLGVIVVSIWKFTPMIMIAVLGKLQTIPSQLYDAAKIDGCNGWQSFWHITYPFIASVLMVVMLIRSIWLFNKWDMIFLLTGGGPLDKTATLPLLLYNEAFCSYNLGRASAVGVIMFLLLILLSKGYFKLYEKAQERV